MPKVVKIKETGKIIYRQSPSFKKGLGIKNACFDGNYKPEDLQEVTISQQEFNDTLEVESAERRKEILIQKRMNDLLRQQAIDSLKAEDAL